MTRAPAPFPIERLADIPERPEDFRLLERIPLTREPQSWPLELSPMVGDEQPMVLLDTETTGLSADDESIIELGMVQFDTVLSRRLASHWTLSRKEYFAIYEAIRNAEELMHLRNRYVDGFHFDNAKAMYDAYTTDIYRFDQA